MTERKSRKSRPVPTVNKEWILGIAEMPMKINPLEGEFVFLVVMEDDLIVGGMPWCIDDKIPLKKLFNEICARPAVGVPRRPKSLVVDNRISGFDVDVESIGLPWKTARTIQITEAIENFDRFDEQRARNDGFDYDEYPPEAAARFFGITAEWAKFALWNFFSDTDVIQISSKFHKLSGWIACIMGNAGQNYGILFFKNFSAYKQFYRIGNNKKVPQKISFKEAIVVLNFENSALVPEDWRKAQMSNGWPVASPDFFPLPEVYGKNMERGIAPGDVMQMISELVEALMLFCAKNHRKVFSKKRPVVTDKIVIDDADFEITFPVVS